MIFRVSTQAIKADAYDMISDIKHGKRTDVKVSNVLRATEAVLEIIQEYGELEDVEE